MNAATLPPDRSAWDAALAVILRDGYGLDINDFTERIGESTLDAYFGDGVTPGDVVTVTNFDGEEWDDLFDYDDFPRESRFAGCDDDGDCN